MKMKLQQLLLNSLLEVENSHQQTQQRFQLIRKKRKKQKKLLQSFKNYSLMTLLLLLHVWLILQLFNKRLKHMKDQEIYLLKRQFKKKQIQKNLKVLDLKLRQKMLLPKYYNKLKKNNRLLLLQQELLKRHNKLLKIVTKSKLNLPQKNHQPKNKVKFKNKLICLIKEFPQKI